MSVTRLICKCGWPEVYCMCPPPSVPSAQAAVENSGPVSSLALAHGSKAVPSAEALCIEWEQHAAITEARADTQHALGMTSTADQLLSFAVIYRRHAEQLRRLAGLQSPAPAASNKVISP